jgi:hypothetical protein
LSEGANFDPKSRRIRWGVFLDANARTFTYALRAPAGVASRAELTGTLSVDGTTHAVAGAEVISGIDAATVVRLVPERDSSGAVQLKIETAPGQIGLIECSSDLVHWSELQPIYAVNGTVNLVDPAGGLAARFYRFRAE